MLKLVKTDNGYTTITSKNAGYESAVDELVEVFKNGEIVVEYDFEDIRARVQSSFK